MAKRRRHIIAVALTTAIVLAVAAFLALVVVHDPGFVIIHADDAGMYASVNAATIDALEKGAVTSCSILVPCEGFDEFAAYATDHPEKDFGVHLTLNCETTANRWGPVSARRAVPSLIDPQGFLWMTASQVAKRAKIEEVETELRAQIEKARTAGIRISHLDHHLFVMYQRSDFLRLYVRLGLEYDIPIRYTSELPSGDLMFDDPELVVAFQEGLESLRARGMPILDDFDGDNYDVPPENKQRYFLDLLRRLKPGVTEIIVHCAYDDGTGARPLDVGRRVADTRVVCSAEFSDAIRYHEITPLNWRQFHERSSSEISAHLKFR